MGEFSLFHWLIVAAILVIFFGPSKLPQLGQSLGKAIRGFKSAMNEVEAEAREIAPNTRLGESKQSTQQQNQQPNQGDTSAEKSKTAQS